MQGCRFFVISRRGETILKLTKKISMTLACVFCLNLGLSGMQAHTVKAEEEGTITFKSNTLVVDKYYVTPGHGQKVNLSFEAEAKDGLADEAEAQYVSDEGKEVDVALSLKDNKYVGELDADKDFGVGSWKISFITIHDKQDASTIVYNSIIFPEMGEDLSAGNFKCLSNNLIGTDKKKAKVGDKVKVTFNAHNESFGLASLGNEASLAYELTDANGTTYTKDVDLKLQDGGLYAGELTVDDSMVDGIWQVSYVILNDADGNAISLYNTKIHGDMGENGLDLSDADLDICSKVPGSPVIKVSTSDVTNKPVNVEISAPGEGTLEYRLGENGTWTKYNGPFAIDKNMTVYARFTNAYGCVSESQKVIANIDITAPAITITGVEDGKTYTGTVTPKISVDDKDATVVTTLNDKAYDGKEIKDAGEYTLKVVATDKAGNKSEKTIKFTVKSDSTNGTGTGTGTGSGTGSNTTNTMPKTGSPVDTLALVLAGSAAAALGFVLTRKKRMN